jgi:hypothetical protein
MAPRGLPKCHGLRPWTESGNPWPRTVIRGRRPCRPGRIRVWPWREARRPVREAERPEVECLIPRLKLVHLWRRGRRPGLDGMQVGEGSPWPELIPRQPKKIGSRDDFCVVHIWLNATGRVLHVLWPDPQASMA